MKAKFACLLIILFWLLIGCSGESNKPLTTDPRTEVAMRNSESFLQEDIEKLRIVNQLWSNIADTGLLGADYRRFRMQTNRTMFFLLAFMAYYDSNDSFPSGDSPEEIISILESKYMMPFKPIDPETHMPLRLVPDAESVIDWQDAFIEIGGNGAFDLTMIYRPGREPYAPNREKRFDSERLYNHLSHTFTISDGINPDITVEFPRTDVGVFATLIRSWFNNTVKLSFLLNDGKVPITLEELIRNQYEINLASWGHPTGPLTDEMPGNFEYGVDPVANGYYCLITDENGKAETYDQFYTSIVAGQAIYDLTSTQNYLKSGRVGDFNNRIPLLTDELFCSPPPDI